MDNARAAPHQSTPGYLLHSLAFDLAAPANHPGSTTIKPNVKQHCCAQHYNFEQQCFVTRGNAHRRGRGRDFMLREKICVQNTKNNLATTSSIAHTRTSPVLPFRATLAPPTAFATPMDSVAFFWQAIPMDRRRRIRKLPRLALILLSRQWWVFTHPGPRG